MLRPACQDRAAAMNAMLTHRSLPSAEPATPGEADAVLVHARVLGQAARQGGPRLLLKGKKLGLLCEEMAEADAALFRRAASELGAHVSHVRPTLSDASDERDVADTGRMLGRLYDAIECQGLSAELVRRLRRAAGVPVYDGLATARHPTAALAEQLDEDDTPADRRRFVVQAALVATIG